MNNGPSPCTQQGRKTTTTCKGVQTEPGTSKSGQIDVEVTTQGQVDGHRHYGTKLEQIHDLLKDELDPAGLLCQCLGIERDLELLDEKMTSLIESMETLRHISYPMKYELKEEQVSSSWPTLLHFGAQYNLANFCDALLSNPMMHGACLTRNKNSFYPQDLARRNGHEELSEQLTLFSNYVSGGRDAKYDSGFSGCIPRLSTITLHRESQADGSVPRPHTALMAPGYIPMRGKLNEENTGGSSSYTDQTESNEEVRTPTGDINPPFTKATRTISDDGGFADEDDEDTENEYHLDDSRLSSSTHSNCSGEGNDDIFGDILNYSAEEERNLHFGRDSERFSTTSKDSSYSVGSKSSFYLDEDCTVPRHRKDIDSFLGTEHPKASPTGKKHFFGFLKKRKSSSKLGASSSSLSTSSKTKVYSRDSNRSSNSSNSSSGGSTSTLQDAKHTDDSSVQYRDLDDHKSKARFKLFMSKAQRRQSIRMKHVLQDTNMSGPTLPPRRKINTETF